MAEKKLFVELAGEHFDFEQKYKHSIMPADYVARQPNKVAALVLSQLQLNTKIFARNCQVIKVERAEADAFLNEYHLMGATQSAFNLGLFNNNELVALASFSKGRKMNRLPAHQRSFELIRFCCKSGTSVTGGLTKLLHHFCALKQAGDVMTYVDKLFTKGDSFIKAGFKKHSETEANYFLIHKQSFERKALKEKPGSVDKAFYLTQNYGNIKLVYTPTST